MTLLEYFVGNEALRSQWAEELNVLQPAGIDCHDDAKVWWRCEKGHEWQARVNSRVYNGRGCPYCSNKSVLPGFNDLATLHPELAAQWHPELNGELAPSGVTPGSKKEVWWRCENGHEWQTRVSSRVYNGCGCPTCAKDAPASGGNDLASVHPELAAQWHPKLNGALSPSAVSRGSKKKVWWLCEKGHEWEAVVKDRALKRRGCPYCSGRKPVPGLNDLATLHPDVAAQWDYGRNEGDPRALSASSHEKVWWICERGHSWQAQVYARTGKNRSGCPLCSGKHPRPAQYDPRPAPTPRPGETANLLLP